MNGSLPVGRARYKHLDTPKYRHQSPGHYGDFPRQNLLSYMYAGLRSLNANVCGAPVAPRQYLQHEAPLFVGSPMARECSLTDRPRGWLRLVSKIPRVSPLGNRRLRLYGLRPRTVASGLVEIDIRQERAHSPRELALALRERLVVGSA